MFFEALKEYILLDVGDYFDGVSFPINIFILSITLGLVVAAFLITYHKRYMHALLKSLVRHNAYDPSHAKTLGELHLAENRGVRRALRRRGQLTDVVKLANDPTPCDENTADTACEQPTNRECYEENVDLATARLYISEQKRDRATQISSTEPPTYFGTAIGVALIFSVSTCITLFMQDILAFLSSI